MIVLNMIARNAEDTIVNGLDSVKSAVDFYVIGFAGKSDDSTREVVLSWLEANAPARFVVLDFEFTDFANARNRVLDATPEAFKSDPDSWMLWMDADDVVKDAEKLRVIAAQAEPEHGSYQFPYVYQTDENGNIMVVHDRERLVRFTLNWRWRRPVHETLWTEQNHKIVRMNDVTWVHNWEANQEDRNKRNMALLFKYLEDEPSDVRTKLYIAHSYFSNQEFEEAAKWFADFYAAPNNVLEKWQAAVFAGDCFFELNSFDMAIGWYMQAIEAMPNFADPYIGLGSCYTKMSDFNKAMYWFNEADNGKELPPPVLFVLPNRYTFNRWATEHYAQAGLGLFNEALETCRKALKHTKNKHDGFQYYFFLYREMIDREKIGESIEHLVYYLQQRGDALAALEFLKFMPRPIQDTPEFEALQQKAYTAVEHLFNPEADIYDGEKYLAGRGARIYEEFPERMERVQMVFERLELLAAKKDDGKPFTVVDIGSGDGLIGIRMAEKYGWNVTVIDANGYNIQLAREYAEKRGVADKMRFFTGTTNSLDLSEIGFHDAAICLEVIEHVLDPANIFMDAMQLANRFIVTTPHQQVGFELNNTPDGVHLHHVREFDYGMLMRLAAGLNLDVELLTTAYGSTWLPGYGNWVFEVAPGTPKKMPVVFFVGSGLEKWTPEQINKEGLGGSETAVVEMAKQFRAAGHPTFVYGPVDGVWDGVFYRNFRHFDPAGPAAGAGALLFISSRYPEIFDAPINAAVRWLWCHDNHYQWNGTDRLTPERAKEINAILVLSEWQREVFAERYPFAVDKLLVTANGIDPERFAGLDFTEREKHRFVWSSSFDRGLDRVLALWPQIREEWSDAELHVYYGFDTADKMYGTDNPGYNEWRGHMETALSQDGVVYHGRTSQKDMPAEFAKASFWLYPTKFGETYCITALETQACGVYPVTTAEGALPERFVDGWPTMDTDEEFIARLRELEAGDVERGELVEYALSNTWDKVFVQWKKEIDANVERNVRMRQAQMKAQETADGTGDTNP